MISSIDTILEEWNRVCELDDLGRAEHNKQWEELLEADPSRRHQYPETYVHPELKAFLSDQYQMSLFHKAILRKPKKSVNYLLTFTHDQKSDKSAFKAAVISQLNREIFSSVIYSFEHEESNIHCHALVTATHSINQSNFKSHIRKYGHVDIRNVKADNGIEDYISKESKPTKLK